MRQRIVIIVMIVLVLGVLIAINAASYQSAEERQDSELVPNRSTYHSGATGTRALYDFLSESGYPVMRWREVPAQLLAGTRQSVATFVIVGDTSRSIDEEEASSLLLWVARGGTLVLVDRVLETQILPASGGWGMATHFGEFPSFNVNPGDVSEMTENVKPVQPAQPTLLTQNVESVMPSRFAASISFTRTHVETKSVPEPV
ncbi:MAG: DUF4350 domain-containing protein, partial [Pyrinomonadaceae bacterium]|nr:DUF4350 domain-containing protein [Pyrinomonadaceae bacterium]